MLGPGYCAGGESRPETVHVDGLARLVLSLAVLLEADLLVHVEAVLLRPGLHKGPAEEQQEKDTYMRGGVR